MNKKLIKIIEKKVGLSLDEIYQMNPVDIARHIEKKMSKKTHIHIGISIHRKRKCFKRRNNGQ